MCICKTSRGQKADSRASDHIQFKTNFFLFLQASISGESGAPCQHIETDMEDGSSDDEMYEEESEDDEDMDETKGRLAWDKDV